MYYVPIIKLKPAEIRLSHYIKDAINHENIIPFLELIYELDNSRKNTTLNDFLNKTDCKLCFIGIPHKPDVIKTDDANKLVTKASKNIDTYYKETIKLFELKCCIPVFYVYKEEDVEYANDFLRHASNINKMAGIITTTNFANTLDKSLLTRNTYLFIDFGKDGLGSKRISLRMVCANNNSNLIIIRENREIDTMNTIIKNGEHVPLNEDLSFDIKRFKNNLGFKISGFGDYCGYKNVATLEGGGGNRDKMFPAWAMYRRDELQPYYLGIRSCKPLSENGFGELVDVTLEIFKDIDPLSQNPCVSILKKENMGNYGPWNVLTEWNYIYQMSKYDEWSELRTLD